MQSPVNGMMPELDRWVVRQILGRLSSGGSHPRFSMNLSAQTLADRSFPAFFADQLSATGVPADCMLFEIDETDALALPDCTARFAATVGSLGAGVIIDGLGRAADLFETLKAPCLQYVKVCIGFAQGFGVYQPHPIESCTEGRHAA